MVASVISLAESKEKCTLNIKPFIISLPMMYLSTRSSTYSLHLRVEFADVVMQH